MLHVKITVGMEELDIEHSAVRSEKTVTLLSWENQSYRLKTCYVANPKELQDTLRVAIFKIATSTIYLTFGQLRRRSYRVSMLQDFPPVILFSIIQSIASSLRIKSFCACNIQVCNSK